MKFLFTFLICVSSPDSLPADSVLCASIRTHYSAIESAEIVALKSEKQHWTAWLPSVGIGYNLQGKPRPTMGYSLVPFSNWFVRKKERANQVEAISLKYEQIIISECAAIGFEKMQIELLWSALKADTERFETETELYLVWEVKYSRAKIKPSEFLPKKISYEAKVSALNNREIEIRMREIQLQKTAYY